MIELEKSRGRLKRSESDFYGCAWIPDFAQRG